MKIYFFKEDALQYFKTNINSNIKKYAEPNCEWVKEEYEDPFIEYKINVPDFKLHKDISDPSKMDIENSKRIYSNLKEISDSQATDERLWAGLTHSTFYEDVQYRWSKKGEIDHMKKASYISTRYFFGQNSPKFRNTLCKLWWIGRLTYDEENKENPFHLTDVLGNNDVATRVNDLFTSNFSRNIKVVKAFLESVNAFDKNVKIIDRDIFRSTIQYINVLGGIYLLDYFEFETLKEMITKQINKYLLEGPDVITSKKAPELYLHDKAILLECGTENTIEITVDMDNIPIFLQRKCKEELYYHGKKYIVQKIAKYKNNTR